MASSVLAPAAGRFVCLQFTPQHRRITQAAAFGSKGGIFRIFTRANKLTAQSDELKSKLKRYGLAGVLSYGFFNTAYYLGSFLFVWFYVAPSPGRLGYTAAAQRFVKLLAMVWAGSQVTKLPRAAAAIALAPLVDEFLNWFTHRFNFRSRQKAFGCAVAACFGFAFTVFLVIVALKV